MKYILDISKLEAPYIILTRGKHLRSKAIRFFSDGDYSHALICLSNTSLIEATVKGRVFTENPQRLIFDNIDDCKVLKLKSNVSEESKKIIELFLRSQVSTLYSIKEAVRTAKYGKTEDEAQENGQFCSRLVAQAYDKINIKLVVNPNYCSPEDLHSSELLEVVPDAIRVATQNDIDFSKTSSQIKENQIQTYNWLDQTVGLAKKEKFNIFSQNDVGDFLMKHPEHDKRVCKYIKETTYLTQYKKDEVVNPPRYKYSNKVSLDIMEEFNINVSIINRHLISYSRTQDGYKKTNLQYCYLLKELYKNMLKQSNTRLNVLKMYIKRDIGSGAELSSLHNDIDQLQAKIRNVFTDAGYKDYLSIDM